MGKKGGSLLPLAVAVSRGSCTCLAVTYAMVPRVPDRFDVQKLSGFTPLGVGKRQLVGKMWFVQELVVTRGVFLYEEWSTA